MVWLLGDHGAVQFADPSAQVIDGYCTYEFLVTEEMQEGEYAVVILPSHEEEVRSSITIVSVA